MAENADLTGLGPRQAFLMGLKNALRRAFSVFLILTIILFGVFVYTEGSQRVSYPTSEGFKTMKPVLQKVDLTSGGVFKGLFVNGGGQVRVGEVVIKDATNNIECRKHLGIDVVSGGTFEFSVESCGTRSVGEKYDIQVEIGYYAKVNEELVSRTDLGRIRGFMETPRQVREFSVERLYERIRDWYGKWSTTTIDQRQKPVFKTTSSTAFLAVNRSCSEDSDCVVRVNNYGKTQACRIDDDACLIWEQTQERGSPGHAVSPNADYVLAFCNNGTCDRKYDCSKCDKLKEDQTHIYCEKCCTDWRDPKKCNCSTLGGTYVCIMYKKCECA